MRVALAVWESRVSPVFDTARQILVADVEDGQIVNRHHEVLGEDGPLRKAARLRELGVDVLICGAVSRPLADVIAASGIRLVPFVTGDVEQTLAAYSQGTPLAPAFLMPGCGRRRRRQFGQGYRGGGRGWRGR